MVDIDQACFDEARAAHLLVAITFHFVPARLGFLAEVIRSLASCPVARAEVVVVTNTPDRAHLRAIAAVCASAGVDGRVAVAGALPHPYELTWAHKPLISDWRGDPASAVTHFVYLEDDERFTFVNFLYFLSGRRILRPYGLLPGYVRTEWSARTHRFVSVDCLKPVSLDKPFVGTGRHGYLNLDNAYCGCFVLDRDMADEYVASRSFDIERSTAVTDWQVRERAAAGLTWEAVPEAFTARTVVPVEIGTGRLSPASWLTHLPNSYADDVRTPFGKVPMQDLLTGAFAEARRVGGPSAG